MSIQQQPQIFNKSAPSTAILNELDLVESIIEYHWGRFEEFTLAAQDHLDRHDSAVAERRQLARQVSRVLAEAERALT